MHNNIIEHTLFYKDSRKYIQYTCKEHGCITQRHDYFKRVGKCKMCNSQESILLKKINNKIPKEKLLKRLRSVHGDKYEYDLLSLKGVKDKIKLKCNKHGWLEQVFEYHIRGFGCPKCGTEMAGKIKIKNLINKKFEGLIQPEEYKLIPLTQGRFAKVDNEDFEKLKDICWFIENGYADNNTHGKMHRLINKTAEGFFTDHINGDRLDNRKSNLRTCTIQENSWNSKPRENSLHSKHKGVHYNTNIKYWIMRIKKDGEVITKSFKTEQEAAISYNYYAKKLFGEFARLNKI